MDTNRAGTTNTACSAVSLTQSGTYVAEFPFRPGSPTTADIAGQPRASSQALCLWQAFELSSGSVTAESPSLNPSRMDGSKLASQLRAEHRGLFAKWCNSRKAYTTAKSCNPPINPPPKAQLTCA